ncbi:MAG: hypothetical protein R3C03_09985 [Pirellulaceae bacterium]
MTTRSKSSRNSNQARNSRDSEVTELIGSVRELLEKQKASESWTEKLSFQAEMSQRIEKRLEEMERQLDDLTQVSQLTAEIQSRTVTSESNQDHRDWEEKFEQRFDQFETRIQEWINSGVASNTVPHSGTEAETSVDDRPMFEDVTSGNEVTGLSTASFLGNWQQQREEMLSAFSNSAKGTEETETEKVEETPSASELSESELVELGATQDDIDEILAIKEQLQTALRETEIEMSIQRAKISQERAALDERASQIEQRERELNRKQPDSGTKEKKSGRNVFRLQSFLGKKSSDEDTAENK